MPFPAGGTARKDPAAHIQRCVEHFGFLGEASFEKADMRDRISGQLFHSDVWIDVDLHIGTINPKAAP